MVVEPTDEEQTSEEDPVDSDPDGDEVIVYEEPLWSPTAIVALVFAITIGICAVIGTMGWAVAYVHQQTAWERVAEKALLADEPLPPQPGMEAR